MPRESGPGAHVEGTSRRGATASTGSAPDTFAELVDRFRSPIHLLCYRLIGSFEEAIQLTYDTFLTGWRLRGPEASNRKDWLMAMAVRACVDHVRRHRPPPAQQESHHSCVPRSDVTWLQPYPDRLLPNDVDADTIGLPYVCASQSLSPRDRATLVLADVEGWSSPRISGALRMSDTDVAPRLERARATVQTGWTPGTTTRRSNKAVLTALVDAFTTADVQRLRGILADDVQVTMPPLPFSFDGRTSVIAVLAHVFRAADPARRGRRRCVPTRANRQPAIAVYVQPHPNASFHGHELVVARVESSQVVELTLFEPHTLPVFGLPTDIPADGMPPSG